ncbi:MAG: hypothetical protein MHMPM18_002997, partial [Marteilia pararefringens]
QSEEIKGLEEKLRDEKCRSNKILSLYKLDKSKRKVKQSDASTCTINGEFNEKGIYGREMKDDECQTIIMKNSMERLRQNLDCGNVLQKKVRGDCGSKQSIFTDDLLINLLNK